MAPLTTSTMAYCMKGYIQVMAEDTRLWATWIKRNCYIFILAQAVDDSLFYFKKRMPFMVKPYFLKELIDEVSIRLKQVQFFLTYNKKRDIYR